MKISAGILIICNSKAMMVHSKNSSWWNTYTPPKGGLEKNETFEEAASRETFEEIGIKIDISLLTERVEVPYIDKKGKIYKKVYLFLHRIDSINDIGLDEDTVKKSQLQLSEIDDARFLSVEEIQKKSLHHYIEILTKILST